VTRDPARNADTDRAVRHDGPPVAGLGDFIEVATDGDAGPVYGADRHRIEQITSAVSNNFGVER
jgi:hypothetical protein